jgi:hypothetical protein
MSVLNMLEKDPQARTAPNLLMNGNQLFLQGFNAFISIIGAENTLRKSWIICQQTTIHRKFIACRLR